MGGVFEPVKSTNCSLFLLSVVCAASNLWGEPTRPNILYLYVDDMGWGALGPNGQFERKAKGLPHLVTPNLDKLAAEGVNFSRSYGCTVCSPARSSQQTGFHQGHTFADRNDPDNAKKAIRADDATMGDVLLQAGYVTGYWGKWGYGGTPNKDAYPEILNVQTLPTSHGYQHVVAELHHVRAHTFFQPNLWKAPASPGSIGGLELVPNSMKRYANNRGYPSTPALQNHPHYPDIAYCDDVYAFAALDFVRIQAQNYNATGQPFFGLFASQVPHAPFREVEQLPEWDQAYRKFPWFDSLSDQAKQWAAMITRIDGHFGNILEALKDPNGDGDSSDSVLEKTLIVFQSDNGGPGDKSMTEFKSNAYLSGQKGRIQEGGIRIPTLMRLPKAYSSSSKLKPGTSVDRVLDVTDLLPTFSELAGVDVPVGLDGVSIEPALTGKGYQREREFVIHEAGNGQSIIRGDYKLIRSKSGLALFNLSQDPSEAKDIASNHSAMVEELNAILLKERVAEAKGFANTYHRWMGDDQADASVAGNWSDYNYENAGLVYMSEGGGPQASWTAIVDAGGDAVVGSDLEFLSLEIKGANQIQEVFVEKGVTLTGLNEIQLSADGALYFDDATIASNRWLDVQSGALLSGSGTVGTALYNNGYVDNVVPGIVVKSDYISFPDSMLLIEFEEDKNSLFTVEGKAVISGGLKVRIADETSIVSGKKYTVLKSKSLSGSFTNEKSEVETASGLKFRIGYTENSVTLTVL